VWYRCLLTSENVSSFIFFSPTYQCTTAGGTWTGFTHQKPAPACEAASWSRENHLGNSGVEQQKLGNSDVLVPPQPAQYMWKLPSWTELTTGATRAKKYTSNGDEYARCVFRLRYNMTSVNLFSLF
jgi:hypothetical protein